uniref:LYR motif-containing protein 2 n=1 Tax=Oncorhynchus tshawytscha TaxID=74940 RepID=A0A8C8D336_ONCTS
MATNNLPLLILFPQFLQRQKVLGLYRNMMRTIRQVPDEGDRKDLRYWAGDEFKRNKNATNQVRYGKANLDTSNGLCMCSMKAIGIRTLSHLPWKKS